MSRYGLNTNFSISVSKQLKDDILKSKNKKELKN